MSVFIALFLPSIVSSALAAEADVQALRPATPGGPLVWTESARVNDGLQAALVLNHAQDLLVWNVEGSDPVADHRSHL